MDYGRRCSRRAVGGRRWNSQATMASMMTRAEAAMALKGVTAIRDAMVSGKATTLCALSCVIHL
jgi:hypothetical protein